MTRLLREQRERSKSSASNPHPYSSGSTKGLKARLWLAKGRSSVRSDIEDSAAAVGAAESSSSPSSVHGHNAQVTTPKNPGEQVWSPLSGVAAAEADDGGKDGDVLHLQELGGIRAA